MADRGEKAIDMDGRDCGTSPYVRHVTDVCCLRLFVSRHTAAVVVPRFVRFCALLDEVVVR